MNKSVRDKMIMEFIGSDDAPALINLIESLDVGEDINVDIASIDIPLSRVNNMNQLKKHLSGLSKTGRTYPVVEEGDRIRIMMNVFAPMLSNKLNRTGSDSRNGGFLQERKLKNPATPLNNSNSTINNAVQMPTKGDIEPLIQTINEAGVIRIIIDGGRGLGHQRSGITVMTKLRNLGFSGKFDIQYRERWKEPRQGYMGRTLQQLIPGFSPKTLDVVDEGWEDRANTTLGHISVTRIPESGHPQLAPVLLTVCGGQDAVIMPVIHPEYRITLCEQYNTEYFIQLQPTDWLERRYVCNSHGEIASLNKDVRLSSGNEELPRIVSPMTLSETEKQILRLCGDPSMYSQLVYGLYPMEKMSDVVVNIEGIDECTRLIEAHAELQKRTEKPGIVFLPQDVFKEYHISRFRFPIMFMDLTRQSLTEESLEAMKNAQVIVVYTGALRSEFFDYLMLKATTLPPVIEGCNSREACESAGRPYIHGGSRKGLKQYSVSSKNQAAQALQTAASKELGPEHIDFRSQGSNLVEYMAQYLQGDLNNYHDERKQNFLNREDAMETALSFCSGMMLTQEKTATASEFKKTKTLYAEVRNPESPEADDENPQNKKRYKSP